MQRGQFVANPDAASIHAPEDHLIDLSESQAPLIVRSRTSEPKTDTIALLGSSPKATFLRRSSGGAEGNTVSVRGNVNDMREHLKHLGPSNLASRPKTTRYNTVKIKGSGNSGIKPIHSDSIVEAPYTDIPAPLGGGEGAGLLKSAGQEAKDGVQAVQQGYGSINGNGLSNLSQLITADGASKSVSSPKGSVSPQPWVLERQTSQGSTRSSDTIGSLVSLGRTPSNRKKGVARSGSITENYVDSGGVRKVVLEASGTSEDERDGSGKSSPTSGPTKSGPDSSPNDDDHEEQQEAGGSESTKKKRRRVRRKKNNSNNAGEESSAGQ